MKHSIIKLYVKYIEIFVYQYCIGIRIVLEYLFRLCVLYLYWFQNAGIVQLCTLKVLQFLPTQWNMSHGTSREPMPEMMPMMTSKLQEKTRSIPMKVWT